MAIHAFAHAALALRRDEAGLIILRDEIVQVVVSLENDIATPPAIAAARPALGDVGLAMKRHAALAAVAGARADLDFIDEHEGLQYALLARRLKPISKIKKARPVTSP